MKIIEKIQVEKDCVRDVICNRCGKTCIPAGGCDRPEGLTEVSVDGGYGSEIIGDGDSLTFSLCERCVARMVILFVIAPEFRDNEDGAATFKQWSERAIKNLARDDERTKWEP
jgi:hypothetical protein